MFIKKVYLRYLLNKRVDSPIKGYPIILSPLWLRLCAGTDSVR